MSINTERSLPLISGQHKHALTHANTDASSQKTNLNQSKQSELHPSLPLSLDRRKFLHNNGKMPVAKTPNEEISNKKKIFLIAGGALLTSSLVIPALLSVFSRTVRESSPAPVCLYDPSWQCGLESFNESILHCAEAPNFYEPKIPKISISSIKAEPSTGFASKIEDSDPLQEEKKPNHIASAVASAVKDFDPNQQNSEINLDPPTSSNSAIQPDSDQKRFTVLLYIPSLKATQPKRQACYQTALLVNDTAIGFSLKSKTAFGNRTPDIMEDNEAALRQRSRLNSQDKKVETLAATALEITSTALSKINSATSLGWNFTKTSAKSVTDAINERALQFRLMTLVLLIAKWFPHCFLNASPQDNLKALKGIIIRSP